MSALLDEAQRRFYIDAMFHARVARVVQALDADLRSNTGSRLDSGDRSLAVLAASAGLLMAERDPQRMDAS